MRDLKNRLTNGKGSKNIQSRRTKSFGYQVLGFGSGGRAAYEPFTGDFLGVAGGASGGQTSAGGGGGAGGLSYSYCNSCASGLPFNVSTTYAVVVGGGGSPTGTYGVTGDDSTLAFNGGTRTIYGGGYGGSFSPGPANLTGGTGGSGGGAAAGLGATGAAGNTPSIPAADGGPGGNNGGNSTTGVAGYNEAAAGGGGRGGVGGNGVAGSSGGAGGVGISNSITGCAVAYAGGGGGGNAPQTCGIGPASPCGTGGAGGGAGGGPTGTPTTTPTPGVANTGGGGGGAAARTPGGGGSGVVIIRSPACSCISVTGGCNTVTAIGPGELVARFVASGNYVVGK